MTSIEIWSIVSSIVSTILGFFAIFLSVYFFVVSKNSEKEVSKSLTKIETQAEMLERLTGKQMDRLTKYVTKERNRQTDDILPSIVTVLSELPFAITASLQRVTSNDDNEQLLNELLTCYISLYFYTVQTNYWSQQYLPELTEFDEDNQSHVTIRNIIDRSNADFITIAEILSNVDPTRLENNNLVHLLTETRDMWKDYVRSSVEVFAVRDKQS